MPFGVARSNIASLIGTPGYIDDMTTSGIHILRYNEKDGFDIFSTYVLSKVMHARVDRNTGKGRIRYNTGHELTRLTYLLVGGKVFLFLFFFPQDGDQQTPQLGEYI